MGSGYLEVMFCMSGSSECAWRVCIELNGVDRALLKIKRSSELGTRVVVRRSGILDLLPTDLENWQRFGAVLEDNVIGTWNGGTRPVIGKDGHKIWILPA